MNIHSVKFEAAAINKGKDDISNVTVILHRRLIRNEEIFAESFQFSLLGE